MLKEAIILAGGMGTRLRPVIDKQPKSMAPVSNRPFLEYLVDYLIAEGIKRFVLSVGYKSTSISGHFGNSYRDCVIEYACEEEPLGTGGAVKFAIGKTTSRHILVANGDSLFLADIREQYNFHLEKRADATLALKPMHNFSRYGTVEVDKDSRLTGFNEKKPAKEGLINGGVYILERTLFACPDLPERFSLEKDLFQKHISQLKFYGFRSDGYLLDIGVPEDYARAQHEFAKLGY